MAENTKTDEPYLRTLAYAIESMSHTERVDALKDFRAETSHQALDSLQASSNMYEDRNFEREPFYAVCKSDFEAERNKYPLNKETKQ